MRKIKAFFILLLGFHASSTLADVYNDLKTRIEKVKSFHVSFTHKMIDSNGDLIQKGYGDLWVKYPNQFNWHMIKPDENVLISDGKTLWFYDPFVEQTIITRIKDVDSSIPIISAICNKIDHLKRYDIKQNGDNFFLFLKNNQNGPEKLIININKDGEILQFSIFEQNNQTSKYWFKFHKDSLIDTSKFTFTPPKGVTVDDQR